MSFQKFIEEPIKPVKAESVRKLVKLSNQKTIEAMSLNAFLWGKVKQHKNGLTLFSLIATNSLWIWGFVAYGVK